MAKVKYIGPKTAGMPVTFPIGVMNKTGWKEVRVANPYLTLTDEEAKKLLELNAHCQCFEIVADEASKEVAASEEKRGPGRPSKKE